MAGVSFFAYEDLSVSTTAVGFTAATRGTAGRATVLVEGAPVRFRITGTPTASVGDTLEIGDRMELESADEVSRITFISRDGATATLRCHFGHASGA